MTELARAKQLNYAAYSRTSLIGNPFFGGIFDALQLLALGWLW